MPRATATADAFSAIAEPRRRRIIALLAEGGAQPVNALIADLGMPQPTVSKHLAVLRRVGLVGVTRLGRQRVYALNPEKLKPVHDWASAFERFWTNTLIRIKERAERVERDTKPPTEQEPC